MNPASDVRFHAELARVGDTVRRDVLLDVADGRFVAVTAGVPAPPDAVRLPGLTLPGFANAHSHVFHRAIRGQSQTGVGDFWAWRDLMYDVADRLDPDSLYAIARATYAEMALAGITSVGEFFYLHHRRDGSSYADPNQLGLTVAAAAADAGIRMTLLDTCYLQADVSGGPLTGTQRRFDDGSWEAWADRVARLSETPMLRIGAAVHSVRAVPEKAIAGVAEYAVGRGLPLHVHLSEQPAENRACLQAFGVTPTALLHRNGALGGSTTAVHATHLTDDDIELLGSTGTTIGMCCTTERDLADGVGPAGRLAAAGSPVCVGSDAHMAIDLLEETRAIELDERLVSGVRGGLSVPALADVLTISGATSLGWDAGRLEAGALADLVTVRLDSPRTAGARSGDPLAHVIFAATACDVTTVVVGGRTVVWEGTHVALPDVGPELERCIGAVLGPQARP